MSCRVAQVSLMHTRRLEAISVTLGVSNGTTYDPGVGRSYCSQAKFQSCSFVLIMPHPETTAIAGLRGFEDLAQWAVFRTRCPHLPGILWQVENTNLTAACRKTLCAVPWVFNAFFRDFLRCVVVDGALCILMQ